MAIDAQTPALPHITIPMPINGPNPPQGGFNTLPMPLGDDPTPLDQIYNMIPAKTLTELNQMVPDNEYKPIVVKIFQSIDTDDNSQLSKDEVKNKLESLVGVLFETSDSNEDGFLEESDTNVAKVTMLNPILDEIFSIIDVVNVPKMNFSFTPVLTKIDQDNDGKFTENEIRMYTNGVMGKIDSNNDKIIDFAEATKVLENMGITNAKSLMESLQKSQKSALELYKVMMDLIDTDKDGKLTKDELKGVLVFPISKAMEKIGTPEVAKAIHNSSKAFEDFDKKIDNTVLTRPMMESLPMKAKEWLLTVEPMEYNSGTSGVRVSFLTVSVIFLLVILTGSLHKEI